MIESGDGLHLALKASHRIAGGISASPQGNITAYDFDGDLAGDTRIFRQVYFTHSSTTQEAHKTITAKLLSFERHGFTFFTVTREDNAKYESADTIAHVLRGCIGDCQGDREGRPFNSRCRVIRSVGIRRPTFAGA